MLQTMYLLFIIKSSENVFTATALGVKTFGQCYSEDIFINLGGVVVYRCMLKEVFLVFFFTAQLMRNSNCSWHYTVFRFVVLLQSNQDICLSLILTFCLRTFGWKIWLNHKTTTKDLVKALEDLKPLFWHKTGMITKPKLFANPPKKKTVWP